MNDSIIKVKNLTKSFKSGESELVVLRNLNFEVPKGQFLSITGRSGSGKSTLLHQIGLLDRPNSGTIEIDGLDVSERSDGQSRSRIKRFQFAKPTLRRRTAKSFNRPRHRTQAGNNFCRRADG